MQTGDKKLKTNDDKTFKMTIQKLKMTTNNWKLIK